MEPEWEKVKLGGDAGEAKDAAVENQNLVLAEADFLRAHVKAKAAASAVRALWASIFATASALVGEVEKADSEALAAYLEFRKNYVIAADDDSADDTED